MTIFFIILGIILVAIDQIIKIWAVDILKPVKSMGFIHFGDLEILGLKYVENTGAAFSSFSGARWFLIVLVTLMLIVLCVFVVKYKYKHPLFMVSAIMIISGGIGNLIDRVRLGYVVDYLDVKLFDFAVFNFADICVVLGVVLILTFMFFLEPKLVKKNKHIDEDTSEKEKFDEQI